MRRSGIASRLVLVSAMVVALVSACGSPKQSVQNCVGASDSVISAIQQKMKPDAKAKLRNGRTVTLPGSETTFVSAELHLESDDPHDKGDVATWATDDIKRDDGFVSVDVHARENSTWRDAAFTVTRDGAIESRACAALNRGKTRAQLECEQRKNSGDAIALPGGKDCSDL